MLREMLETEVSNWACLGHPALLSRFILRHGRTFTPRKRLGRRQRAKQCFLNAAQIVFRDGKATYVEGFILNMRLPIMPILHAWVTYDGKHAMDPTLPNERDYEYLGMTFDTDTLRKETVRNGVYGLLDPGIGYNTRLIFAIDPALEQICHDVKKAAKVWDELSRKRGLAYR